MNHLHVPHPKRLAAAVLLVSAALAASPAVADRPPATRLLPAETGFVLTVVDAPELSEAFMNTALGRMSQDPQLAPLVEQVYGSLAQIVAEAEDRVGLSLPELLAVPQGELTLAMVAPEEKPPALVLLLDAGSQLPDARKLVERADAALEESGAKGSERTVAGTKMTVYENVGPRNRQLIFFEKDATVVVGSDLEVLKELLAVWDGKEAATLAENAKFAAVMGRCRGSGDEAPQVFWYADPIAMMRSIGQRRTSVQVAVAVLPALGLDGLSAVGGSIAMDAGKFDSIVHTHVLMDHPRNGVLKMIAFRPGETKPQRWVPPDVSSYTTLHWDVQTTYQTLRVLFDSFRGEGALDAAVKRRIDREWGASFAEEVLPLVGTRVTHLNWIERPVTIRSQGTLVAFELTDAEAAGKVLEKIYTKHESNLLRQTYGGQEYFVAVPREPRNQEERARRPPSPSFGILDGNLVMTDRESLYRHAITTLEGEGEPLADALDFKLVASKIRRQAGGTQPAMLSFNRPEEGMRLLYGLATADGPRNRLREGGRENRFLKGLDEALEQNPLPPFAVLQQYLAPGGAMVLDDETGIHYLAFSLRRNGN